VANIELKVRQHNNHIDGKNMDEKKMSSDQNKIFDSYSQNAEIL
jgi:hypothetical protein